MKDKTPFDLEAFLTNLDADSIQMRLEKNKKESKVLRSLLKMEKAQKKSGNARRAATKP